MMGLLGALSRHGSPVNLKQLAAETRLHPSTAHRILSVMVGSRLVDRIEPGTYRLGIRLLELGNLVKSRISVRQEALPHMQEVAAKYGKQGVVVGDVRVDAALAKAGIKVDKAVLAKAEEDRKKNSGS